MIITKTHWTFLILSHLNHYKYNYQIVSNFDRQYIYKPTKRICFRFSYLWYIWPSSLIYSKTKPVYKKILSTKHKCEISSNQLFDHYFRKSLLCLDLNHITGSDNYCTTATESIAHAVDNTYKPCCPIVTGEVDAFLWPSVDISLLIPTSLTSPFTDPDGKRKHRWNLYFVSDSLARLTPIRPPL